MTLSTDRREYLAAIMSKFGCQSHLKLRHSDAKSQIIIDLRHLVSSRCIRYMEPNINPAGGGPTGHLPRGGGHLFAPRISETTERIRKIQTAFHSPLKFAEGNLISLSSGSPMTSQVRSKIKCFTVLGSSRECAITPSKTHFVQNQR